MEPSPCNVTELEGASDASASDISASDISASDFGSTTLDKKNQTRVLRDAGIQKGKDPVCETAHIGDLRYSPRISLWKIGHPWGIPRPIRTRISG